MASSTIDGNRDVNTGQNPLFIKEARLLDSSRHCSSGILPTSDLSFARSTNSILINIVEFFDAAKYYPIVFTSGLTPHPVVVVGLETANYFVDVTGKWNNDSYVPAYVRKYPFVLMENTAHNKVFLCIDESSPHFRNICEKDVLPLFDEGKPSVVTMNALQFCTEYQNHHDLTQKFSEDIVAAGLLKPMQSDVTLFNGREIHLGGFLSVSERHLKDLPDTGVLDFHRKGWLPLLHAALMSGRNWSRLVDLAAKHERAAMESR